MAFYVFDTDVSTDLLLGDPDATTAFELLRQDKDAVILVSEVTRAELLCLTKVDVSKVDDLIECFDEVIEVDEVVARKAADLRKLSNGPIEKCSACGKRTGGKLKMADAMIAATAVTEDAILVTRNRRDFQRLFEVGVLTIQDPKSIIAERKTVVNSNDQE